MYVSRAWCMSTISCVGIHIARELVMLMWHVCRSRVLARQMDGQLPPRS